MTANRFVFLTAMLAAIAFAPSAEEFLAGSWTVEVFAVSDSWHFRHEGDEYWMTINGKEIKQAVTVDTSASMIVIPALSAFSDRFRYEMKVDGTIDLYAASGFKPDLASALTASMLKKGTPNSITVEGVGVLAQRITEALLVFPLIRMRKEE